MALAVLLAKCLSVHSHMMMIAYYDVLIMLTSHAMHDMLFTCDIFADNFSIVFSAKNQSVYLNILIRLIVL